MCQRYRSAVFFLIPLFLLFFYMPSLSSAQIIPENVLILKEEGDRAITRGQIDQAIMYYEKALSIHKDFPEVIYYLGLIYDLDLGDLSNAIYYYRLYLELAPNGEQSAEVLSRLQDNERKLNERNKELGISDIKTEPSAPTIKKGREPVSRRRRQTVPSPQIKTRPPSQPSKVSSAEPSRAYEPYEPLVKTRIESTPQTGNNITLKIQEKILKYDLKLTVWRREGFIDQFNALSQVRGSPLEVDVASQRESLRIERKRVTDFINYTDEAVKYLFKKGVLHGMAYLGIELDHFPKDWAPQNYITRFRIIDNKEDSRFINLSIEATVDIVSLRQELIQRGYIFEPHRITLILQGVQHNIADNLIEKIIRYSDYTGPFSAGLFPLYTSLDIFDKELQELEIGKYRFKSQSIGNNTITVHVWSTQGQPLNVF